MDHSMGSSKPESFLFWASAERGQPAKLVSSTSQASTTKLCMPVVNDAAYSNNKIVPLLSTVPAAT